MSDGEFIRCIETRRLDNKRLHNLLRAAMNAQEKSQHAVSRSMRRNLPIDDADLALNTICDVVCVLLEEMLKEKEQ